MPGRPPWLPQRLDEAAKAFESFLDTIAVR
jgi:hypothetical protein